jgi:hypothetical protein
MPALTEKEVGKWLVAHGHPPDEDDPIAGTSESTTQFYAPREYSKIQAFVRCYLAEIVVDGDVLIVVEDAYSPSDCDPLILKAILEHFEGESYNFEELPTLCFPTFCVSKKDWEKAIALFTLMTCFRWQCFLYGSANQLTLFNWEGDIFDFWTDSKEKKQAMKEMIRAFKLKEIRRRRAKPL